MYATCETPGCGNQYAPIPVDGDGLVICGPCGNPITTITDLKPDEGKELPAWILQMLQVQN